MSVILFTRLLVCAIVVALSLFALQSNSLVSIDTIISMYEMFSIVVETFIYCHLSDQATTHLLNVEDIFYDCVWYMLPVKQQKLFILPMQRAQRQFYFSGLGMVDCSLETFAKVFSLLVELEFR